MKHGHIIQAWLVIVLATAFGAALAAVQDWLGPRIEQNKRGEMLAEAPRLVPGSDASMCQQMAVAGKTVWKVRDSNGGLKGWVIRASGQGYSDTIELLVGLDAAADKITGVYVVDQKETPDLGSKIRSDWINQYRGQNAGEPLTVTKTAPAGAGQIMAITGATISSDAVTKIVNEAVASVRGPLQALAREGAK